MTDDINAITPHEISQLELFLQPVLPEVVRTKANNNRQEVVLAGVSLEYAPTFSPPDVVMKLILPNERHAEVIAEIEKLVDAWYLIGAFGGLGGTLHSASRSSTTRTPESTIVSWAVDVGDAGDEAISTLVTCLRQLLAMHGISSASLILE